MEMTGPRMIVLVSRKEGTKGGEILASTLILLRKGMVMTVASTLEPSCENGVEGVTGVVVFSGGSFKLGSGCDEPEMLPNLWEWIKRGLGWCGSGRLYGEMGYVMSGLLSR